MNEQATNYFKNDAKQIVDVLFDSGMFIKGISRDDMNSVEEMISYCMQSRFDSHIKAFELFEKIKNKKKENNS